MTIEIFCFYLQNRQIQTSETGGQWYSDTSPLSIPWLKFVRAGSYQVFRLAGDFVPVGSDHSVLPLHDLPDEHHLFPVPERRSSYEEGVHDDPAGPGIHFEPITVAFVLKKGLEV